MSSTLTSVRRPAAPRRADAAAPTSVLRAPSVLDAVSASTLAGWILAAPHGHDVVVDLVGTTWMDSAGLAAVVTTRRALRRDGRSLELRGAVAPAVRTTLAVTGFDRLFHRHDELVSPTA